jgi:hypothetical protein
MTRPTDASSAARSAGAVWATRVRPALRVLAVFFLAPLVVGNLLGPPGAGWAACVGASAWSSPR